MRHIVAALGVDADAQLELGVLDGSRLEHSSALRIVKAERKADGAVAVEVLGVVVSSITWANVKQILVAAADLPQAGRKAVDAEPELLARRRVQRVRGVDVVVVDGGHDDHVDVLNDCAQ